MTQEDKNLLLKDLCARLRYGVKVRLDTGNKAFDTDLVGLPSNNTVNIHDKENYETIEECFIWNIKPYLRPLSSMTEEEISDLQKINCQFSFNKFDNVAYVGAADDGFCSVEEMDNILDYLNSKHLDYRHLIEEGLAIEVTEENNPYI